MGIDENHSFYKDSIILNLGKLKNNSYLVKNTLVYCLPCDPQGKSLLENVGSGGIQLGQPAFSVS